MIVLIMAMFSTALPTLIVFPEERPVFLREFSTNHYSVVSYFFSRLALEAFLTAVQVLVAVGGTAPSAYFSGTFRITCECAFTHSYFFFAWAIFSCYFYSHMCSTTGFLNLFHD
jgi:hypothetical protein